MTWIVYGAVAWLILMPFVALGIGRMIRWADEREQPARPALTLVGS